MVQAAHNRTKSFPIRDGSTAPVETCPPCPCRAGGRSPIAAAALALLAVAGRTLAGAGTATEQPAAALVPERAAAMPPLVVHVAGAVRRPGLYRLAEGKRVADAVARAGGATAPADTAAINLAAPLADGIQVIVPRRFRRRAAVAPAGLRRLRASVLAPRPRPSSTSSRASDR